MSKEIERNFEKWPIIGNYVWPNPEPIAQSYEEEISNLKNWIKTRIKWFDENLYKITKSIN